MTEENFSDQKIVSPVRIIYFSCNRLGEKKLKLMEISKEEPEAKRRMGRERKCFFFKPPIPLTFTTSLLKEKPRGHIRNHKRGWKKIFIFRLTGFSSAVEYSKK